MAVVFTELGNSSTPWFTGGPRASFDHEHTTRSRAARSTLATPQRRTRGSVKRGSAPREGLQPPCVWRQVHADAHLEACCAAA